MEIKTLIIAETDKSKLKDIESGIEALTNNINDVGKQL